MTRNGGSLLGAAAIAAWSCYGVLIASNTVTPPFLSMAIVFTCSTIVLLARRLLQGRGVRDLIAIPLPTLALGFVGLFGTNCLYVLALALGGEPIAVNIASLSWPVFMMALITGFGLARATWLDGAAMVIGFAGVIMLAVNGTGVALDWPILVTTIGALCWAAYSAFRNKVPSGPADSMTAFVGLSAACCWSITLLAEQGTVPVNEFIRLVAVGVIPVGLANLAWDLGTRYGDQILLAGLSFLEPVVSTLLIAVVLSESISRYEFTALGMILAAVSLSVFSERVRRRADRKWQPPALLESGKSCKADGNCPR